MAEETASALDMHPAFENPTATHYHQLRMVPKGAFVLDVGCHSGELGKALREKRGADVIGIDNDAEAIVLAKLRLRDALLLDIEIDDWTHRLKTLSFDGFDVIIFGDVLEHTRKPDHILAQARSLLKQEGVVIVSIPNVAHWRVRFGLFLGRFSYADSGILDRTHLRFYTRKTARTFIESAGYEILEETVAGYSMPHLVLRSFPGLLAVQFIFRAKRKG